MPVWICPTCGAHHAEAERPPRVCDVCTDERQWVPPAGQRWTTMSRLADEGYETVVAEVEPGLYGIGTEPGIGVGQRGLLVCTPEGNVLWDPPAYIDQHAIDRVRSLGGLRMVTASHPHMYGAIVDWADEFDAAIPLPEADLAWLHRDTPLVHTWSNVHQLLPDVTLVQCGGHFPGSTVLHWSAGADGSGVILVGDTIMVTPGEDRVTFMYSAPNRLPLPERGVRGIVDALHAYRFDRIYSGWWEPVLRSGAADVLPRSAERYIQFLRGEVTL